MIHFVCNKNVVHNGVHYKTGQAWDGDLPAPQVGVFWSIRQDNEPDDPRPDSIVTSASKGFVQWKPQPDRPRAQPLSPEEKQQLESDPYANLDEPAPAAPPPADPLPPRKEKQTPIAPFQQTQAEIDDPYGLKAKAAATTAELQKELEKEDSPVDPPEK